MTEYKVEMRTGETYEFYDLKEYHAFSKKHSHEIKSTTISDYIGPMHSTAIG